MDDIWFYTLSTSAQVLAALAGLFAVFVVWKIQDFEKILSDTRLAIIKIVSYLSANTKNFEAVRLESLYSMNDSEILKKFSELLTIKISDPSRIGVSQTIHSDLLISYALDDFTEALYKNHIEKKSSIIGSLKKILIINFSMIGVCIFALTFSYVISYKPVILPLISTGVFYSLFLLGSGIYKITVK